MIGYGRGQNGVILPAWECPFCSHNKISPKYKRVHESFLLQNIFHDSKKIFCDFSFGMELENEKTESLNKNENKENKENKNLDEFQGYILQQKLANTKVQTQSDMKVWNVI